MSVADRGMALGLRALNRVAGLEAMDRLGLRGPAERLVHGASRNGFRAAAVAGRTFAATQRRAKPARLKPDGAPRGLFDLTPTEEQQMLAGAAGEFAAEVLRPAAHDADAAAAAPAELLERAQELGLTALGVPEDAGGAVEERSAVTTVLMAEKLAHGDLGLAFAVLAPAAVSTALGLWGDADQQSTYLPPFVGDDVPVAALAVLEPRPLFNPFELRTTARREGDGFVLDGIKALVPGVAASELFVVAAQLDDRPALFIVEPGTAGVQVEPEPAMGLRPAATGRLVLEGVSVPSGALLGGGDPDVYREAIHLGRLAWCGLAIGTSRAVLDYVIPYVNERVAFGEPVSNRQAVAFAVADVAIELEGMRLATLRAASLADQGKPFFHEAAVARRLVVDKASVIGSQGVQLLGGHGYVKEHPVERWYRDLRAVGVMEGALLV